MKQDECGCIPQIGQSSYTDATVHLCKYDKRRYSIGKKMILSMKERNIKNNFDFISKELADAINLRASVFHPTAINISNAVITSVPRNPKAKRVAGYDQAEKLAKNIAKLLDKPYYKLLTRRNSYTQKSLSYNSRLQNAFMSYRPYYKNIDKAAFKTVIIIDDVMTSGATIEACAKQLKDNGVHNVIAATIGRTYNNNNNNN